MKTLALYLPNEREIQMGSDSCFPLSSKHGWIETKRKGSKEHLVSLKLQLVDSLFHSSLLLLTSACL